MRIYKHFFIALALALAPVSAQMMAVLAANGSSAAPGYTGPGDIQSGASAWWGLRAYSAAKRGSNAVRLCDAGDAHCIDAVTNASTGALVIPSSNPNCSASGCTISKWYDQSGATNCGGSACDASQATEASRAVLTVSCLGSLPCAVGTIFVGEYNTAAPITTQTQPYTISTVSARTGAFTSDNTIIYLRDGGGFVGYAPTTGLGDMWASGSFATATAANTTTHAFQAMFSGASSNLYIDGAANTVNPGTTAGGGTSNVALMGYAGIGYFSGNLFEVGVWSGDKSANNSAVNGNQHTYWGF